eukprot:scaffold13066_cov45-Phaeocystis_antarctica.AAC.1
MPSQRANGCARAPVWVDDAGGFGSTRLGGQCARRVAAGTCSRCRAVTRRAARWQRTRMRWA